MVVAPATSFPQVVRLSGLATYLYPLSSSSTLRGSRADRGTFLTRLGVPAGFHTVLLCPQSLVKVHPSMDALFDALLVRFPGSVVVRDACVRCLAGGECTPN